jgi:hypothetical protein
VYGLVVADGLDPAAVEVVHLAHQVGMPGNHGLGMKIGTSPALPHY